MTETVIGQLEDEPRPLAGPAGDADRAADRVHHALHDVEPDARGRRRP